MLRACIPERLGIVEEGQRRSALYHGVKPVAVPRPVLVVKPIHERGRFIPHSLGQIIALVARCTDSSVETLTGNSIRRPLVHGRSCAAVLAAEFTPRLSCVAVDDALLRGHGMCIWYRERHLSRLALYPAYAALYERCRVELLK